MVIRGWWRLDMSTRREYTKLKSRLENRKHFNGSKRNPQILPLRPLGSTRPLNGLVNFLNFHKNTKEALLARQAHGRATHGGDVKETR
jgi:hypothetical protein